MSRQPADPQHSSPRSVARPRLGSRAIGRKVDVYRRADLPGVELARSRSMPPTPSALCPCYVIGLVAPAQRDSAWTERWLKGRWITHPGHELVTLEPGEVLVTRSHSGPVDADWLFLDPQLVDEHAARLSLPRPASFSRPMGPAPEAAAVFDRACQAVTDGASDASSTRLAVVTLIEAVLQGTADSPPRARELPACSRTVRRVRELLETAYATQLTLDVIAAELGRSKYHLAHAFKENVGIPIHEYLQHVRVNRALDHLKRGVRPRDVAALVGFADQSHMTRVFRAVWGFTPAVYARATGPANATA